MNSPPFQPGDAVTNALGWFGTVIKCETFEPIDPTQDGLYWWVYWRERQNHHEATVRRQPTLGHLTSQIKLVSLNHD